MASVLLCCSAVLCQKSGGEPIKVRGTVSAFDHFTLKNAQVTAKKTKTKALTDSLGEFEIMAREGDILLFRANGFEKNTGKWR